MIKISAKAFLLLMGCVCMVACGPKTSRGTTAIILDPPAPPPTAPTNFDTAEFRNNYGLDLINAITLYDNGATGQGITVAVIDSGIDRDHPQIAANIHASSTNIVTGNVSDLEDIDGHGTAVAGVIAAIRDPGNNSISNTHGVAFNARVMALNTASVGSCAGVDGCEFFDNDIAAALDYARTRGVKVVNISLGGDGGNSPALVAAYQRAVTAGMVIIISAGNRDEGDTDLDIAQPENSASVAWANWANGQIIVAGSVGQSTAISTFSHRAGDVARNVFLVAGGESIPSLGADGGFFLWSGTSFSAPHIAGAAALLFDAFPNLTGKQLVDLLYSTARDLGAPGADVIYGQGLVNLAEAFNPQGVTSVAVQTTAGKTANVDMAGSVLLGGKAFGGFAGLSAAVGNSMMLDGFNRSFRVDLGARVFDPGSATEFDALVGSRRGHHTASLNLTADARASLSWTEDWRFQEVDARYFSHQNKAEDRIHDVRLKLNLSLGAGQHMTFAQGLSLKEAIEDYNQDEYLTIGKQDFMALMGRNDSQSVRYGQNLTDRTRLNLVVGHGAQKWEQYNLKADNYIMMVRLDHALSPAVTAGVDLGLMTEEGSVLGSLSQGALSLGTGGATTFVNVRAGWKMAEHVNFFAKASYGSTRVTAAELSLVAQISHLSSGSFSFGVTADSLFQRGDSLSFAVSQPLRVMGGHADISYVTARNFATDSLSFISNQVSLAPGSREIDFELAYRIGNIFGARMDLNILHQMNPGHNAENANNSGILIRLGSEF